MLQGQYKTAWKQVVHENFPQPTNPEMVPIEQDRSSKANFCRAMELFIVNSLSAMDGRDRPLKN